MEKQNANLVKILKLQIFVNFSINIFSGNN